MSDKINDFKEKLDAEHSWPSNYMFKFIVPSGKEELVYNFIPRNKIKLKASKKGNYISITATLHMSSSDEIIAIYEQANTINGLIAL